MDLLTRYLWLYVRGQESIRITRSQEEFELFVCGPGSAEQCRTFDSLDTLKTFLDDLLYDLQQNGWTLHGTVDRRVNRRSTAPVGGERRRTPEMSAADKDEPA